MRRRDFLLNDGIKYLVDSSRERYHCESCRCRASIGLSLQRRMPVNRSCNNDRRYIARLENRSLVCFPRVRGDFNTERLALVFMIFCCWAALATAAPTATFTPLGGIAPTVGAGQDVKSTARAVSADGSTIVGQESLGFKAVRWDGTAGPIPLFPTSQTLFGSASDVSRDGSVIVGTNVLSPNAFRWSASDGITPIMGPLSFIEARGVSGDGEVVVGSYAPLSTERQAYRWTASTGVIGIGYLPGGSFSIAEAANADGTVIVGQSSSGFYTEPFRWTSSGGMAPLQLVDGTQINGYANDVTADGSVVVGYGYFTNPYSDSFRWSEAGGLVKLDPPPGSLGSFASGVSNNGAIIVGSYETATGIAPFVWTAAQGMRDLQSLLVNDYGLDLSGWKLTFGSGISSDGSVLVGWGIDPQGKQQGWRVELPIPEPASFILIIFSFTAWWTRLRTRK
jgi:uncharacterized membrane protein